MRNGFLKKFATLALTGVICIAAGSPAFAGKIEVDPNLSDYVKVGGVAGNLNSIGSDTLNNLMTLWAEKFRKKYPNVNIQIEGKGSSTAPPALIEGTAQLGPMSRQMKNKEAEAFESKYGFKPTTIGVALDSLAVYINKDNPISIYGRNSASGTYGYFKKKALCKGDYKNIVKEQPGSASVVLGVTEDKAGIGYSGIGYKTSGVKAVALSKKQGGKAYGPTYENVLEGKYPLGRLLYINVVKKPGQPLPKLIEEFLTFVLSEEGQEIVVKDGYLPLPAKVADKQLAKIK